MIEYTLRIYRGPEGEQELVGEQDITVCVTHEGEIRQLVDAEADLIAREIRDDYRDRLRKAREADDEAREIEQTNLWAARRDAAGRGIS